MSFSSAFNTISKHDEQRSKSNYIKVKCCNVLPEKSTYKVKLVCLHCTFAVFRAFGLFITPI